MQRVAQDWLVLQLPGNSGTALGITTGLQFLPVLLLSPYAGVIADRFPKRRLLQVTQAVMAGASLVLGLITVLGVVQVWHVYLLAFVFGIGSAFDAPARQSFVSELVDQDDVTNAVGLNSAAFNLARILGPGLAGLMIGALGGGAAATGWVILINAVSYAATITQLQRMDTDLLHTPTPVARTPGMLLDGALMSARRSTIRVRLLIVAALGFGAAEIAAGLMPSYVLFAAMCPVIGFCTLTLLNSANATMQLESDPVYRGRVMALYMTIVMGGTPLGSPVIGWVGESFGPRWTLILGGVLVIVGAGLASSLLLRSNARRRPVADHRVEER